MKLQQTFIMHLDTDVFLFYTAIEFKKSHCADITNPVKKWRSSMRSIPEVLYCIEPLSKKNDPLTKERPSHKRTTLS